MTALFDDISLNVDAQCASNQCYDDHIISVSDVRNAVKKMKASKCDANVEALLSILVPIPKDRKKAFSDGSYYKSIALSSILLKILNNIAFSEHKHVLLTGDLQCGFKAGHSTM